jgi:alpha-2-macroglobulin
LRHEGGGAPVAQLTGEGFSAPKEGFSRNASIQREVTAVRQQRPGQWSVGDVVQVRLRFQVPRGGGWYVVSDAIPPGATVLGSGLGGQGELPTGSGNRRGWRQSDGSWEAWPSYVERGFTHVRAYYEFLWGEWSTLTYQLRLNNAGVFNLPPTDVQAMYEPDVQAIEVRAPLEVK